MRGRTAMVFYVGGKLWFYKAGTIKVIGDLIAYKYSGSSCTLTKYSSYFTVENVSARGWAYGQNAVDLTDVTTLWIYANTPSVAGCQLGVGSSYTTYANATAEWLPSNGATGWVSLDVSVLSGSYYLKVGRFTSEETVTVSVENLYGE